MIFPVLQMSLAVETNLQMTRGKNKQHLLCLHHREVQKQKRKGMNWSLHSGNHEGTGSAESVCRIDAYTGGLSSCCSTCMPVHAVVSLWSRSSSSSNSSNKSDATEVAPNTLINTFPRAPVTSDSIRLKCREMIANALQTGGNPLLEQNLVKQAVIYIPLSPTQAKIFSHINFPPQTIILPSVLIVKNLGHRLKNISFI